MCLRRTVTFLALVLVVVAACSDTDDTGAATTQSRPATSAPGAGPPGTDATVVRVLDGDSILVDVDGASDEVRLVGINAPDRDECFGSEARDALTELLEGSAVVLVAAGADDRDQYGRALRYVYLGTENVNEGLVRDGLALAIASEHPAAPSFRAAYDAAWRDRTGMWSPTACSDAAPPDLVIGEFRYDPEGRDGDDLNGEWIELVNDGAASVVIGGWMLRDESTSHRFVLPDEFSLEAGATVRIHVGCGTDSARSLYWCSPVPVLNNGGDSVILSDPAGTVVALVAYG